MIAGMYFSTTVVWRRRREGAGR